MIFIADLHIKLGQKNVPREWQRNRFMLLAEELAKLDYNTIVIAGDLLDVAKPSIEEVGLLYDFLKVIRDREVILIPGNHEMDTKKLDCYRHIEGMLDDLEVHVIRDFQTKHGIDFIPYNILHSNWHSPCSKLAITHVRGEIPPHVEPEIDLGRFNEYDKVFAGDLHSYTNSQGIIYYPGSPFSTSFHRSVSSGSNGYFIIDSSTGDHEWIEFKLPQLVRKTISDAKDMVATDFHHTIYELEGDLETLAKIENSELLDKKITNDISAPATLNMTGDITEELAEFLVEIKEIKEEEIGEYITLFKDIIIDSD